MITKQCKKNIHMHTIYSTMFVGVLIMLCMLIIMYALHAENYFVEILVGCGVILVVSVIVGYIISMPKVSRFKKHLKNENGNNIDLENFKVLDKHISVSDNWIVYHKGTHYVPVYKKNISSIQFDGHKCNVYVRNNTYVYTLKCNEEAKQELQSWYNR